MITIAQIIESKYYEEEPDKAYKDYCAIELPEEPLPDDHDGYGVWWTNWKLKGKKLNFTLCFEKYEGYQGWAMRCPDEETCLKKKVMTSIYLSLRHAR